MFSSTIFVVVEADIPYRNEQVEQYGPTFRRWGRDDLEKLTSWLSRTLPIQQFALLVCYSLSRYVLGLPRH